MRPRAAGIVAAVALGACGGTKPVPRGLAPPAAIDAPATPAPVGLVPVPRTLDVNTESACAITGDHRVACWGSGAIIDAFTRVGWTTSATRVPDLADVVQLALGDHEVCVVRAHGEVACLGTNEGGELGVADPKATRAVVAGLPPAKRVAVGHDAACTASADGSVWCWGALEDQGGSQFQAAFPVDGIRDAVDVAVGAVGGCALRASGRVACFQVHPTAELAELPDEHVVEIVARFDRRCLRLADGASRCFVTRDPTLHAELLGAKRIAANAGEQCMIAWDGNVACSGFGAVVVPRNVMAVDATVNPYVHGAVELALGQAAACVRFRDDTIACWGDRRDTGVLGDGEQPVHLEPYVVDLPPVAALLGGGCVRLVDGRLRCWGINGELPEDPLANLSRVHAGDSIVDFTGHCGLTRGGLVECWQLDDPALAGVLAGLSHIVAIVGSLDAGCTIDRAGKVACWEGYAGLPATALRPIALDERAVQLVADNLVTCARLASGKVACWGDLTRLEELGAVRVKPDGDIYTLQGVSDATELAFGNQLCVLSRAHPAACFGGTEPIGAPAVQLAHATHVAIGSIACWIDATDRVECLGFDPSPAGPRTIDVHGKPVAISVDGMTACVLRADRTVACFGAWSAGELGDGASTYAEAPIAVRGWPPP